MTETDTQTQDPSVLSLLPVFGLVTSFESTETDAETVVAAKMVVINDDGLAAEIQIMFTPDWLNALHQAHQDRGTHIKISDTGEKSQTDLAIILDLIEAGVLVRIEDTTPEKKEEPSDAEAL